jgi:hypothetical protein
MSTDVKNRPIELLLLVYFMNQYLSIPASLELISKIDSSGLRHVYHKEKNRIVFLDELNNEVAYFRLPIVASPGGKVLSDELNPLNYVILLIQSGSCAVGYFENGINVDHKVFRSYMVRKKQGKSQIKYLKTRGKSKAGSRVRLGETVEFFENINERLQEYFQEFEIHRIAISCSKTLIPYLFNSKVATPFEKRDERILKIPKHIHQPIYEVLMDVNKFLLKGELIYEPENKHFIQSLINEENNFEGEDFFEDGNAFLE